MSNINSYKDLTPDIIRKHLPQIAWRREMKKAMRAEFDEKYPEDVLTAFLMSGKQYFDRELLVARKLELFGFVPYQVVSNGESVLFKPRKANRRYIMAADVATGRTVTSETTDNCAGVVIDLETGEEMAGYCAHVTPQDLAHDLADLGRYYNNAVAAIERTGDGGTTILTMQGDAGYGNIYKHKEWWKRQRKVIEIEGFPTTPKTRPVALNYLNDFILNNPELIYDEQFINEALVFVRDEKGKPAATPGAHDDRVSARWIAYAVRQALLGYWEPWSYKAQQYISADRMVVTG